MKIKKTQLVETLAKQIQAQGGGKNSKVIAEATINRILKEGGEEFQQTRQIPLGTKLALANMKNLVKDMSNSDDKKLYGADSILTSLIAWIENDYK